MKNYQKKKQVEQYNFWQFLFKKQKTMYCEKGFVILVAVVVSTLLVSIGVFISTTALKELQLAASTKNSLQAFYAADSAIECALFHDFNTGISGGPFPRNQYDITNNVVSPTVSCNGMDLTICHAGNTADVNCGKPGMEDIQAGHDFSISYFEVPFYRVHQGETENAGPYARVRIEKYDIGGVNDETVLQAYGHNRKSGIQIVERGLKVAY